jgi:penicillin-binding protein 1A
VAAVPIFIEFMKEALKGAPKLDFVAPPGTVFAQVGPNREAFRPGTIPVRAVASSGGGGAAGQNGPTSPNDQQTPSPKAIQSKKPDELNGLF